MESSKKEYCLLNIFDYNKHLFLGKQIIYDDADNDVEYNRDSSLMVTWSKDSTARLWHTEDGSPAGEPMTHDAGNKYPYVSTGAMFNDNESLLLTWSWDGTARLWYTKMAHLQCPR